MSISDNIQRQLNTDEIELLEKLMNQIKQLVNRNAFINTGDKVVANNVCYGTVPPEELENPVEGQIYFYIESIEV